MLQLRLVIPVSRSKKMPGKPEGSGRFNVRVLYDRLQTERFFLLLQRVILRL